LDFWSVDKRFGIRIKLSLIKDINLQCAKSYPQETGGILTGFYNEELDCAEVTNILFEPKDSQKGKTWFIRGTWGLQKKLNTLWRRKKEYYLGEWHFHPNGDSYPSSTDIRQMLEIASSSKIHCPEPILIIFSGGNNPKNILNKAYVFSKEKTINLNF
jgi:integrative and conjugative element protein (TIGR02256 family)